MEEPTEEELKEAAAAKDPKEKEKPNQPVAAPAEIVDEELREIETKYKTLKVMSGKFLKEKEWTDMVANLL